jgi:hypothetical protein
VYRRDHFGNLISNQSAFISRSPMGYPSFVHSLSFCSLWETLSLPRVISSEGGRLGVISQEALLYAISFVAALPAPVLEPVNIGNLYT